jgi:membrane-associated phospholipid phosphatase
VNEGGDVGVLLVYVAIAAVLAGGIVGFAARHWPAADITAPRVSPQTVVEEVRTHRRLREALGRRIDPTTTTGLALTVAVVVIALGAVLAGILLIMIRTDTGLARWDPGAARFGARHATDMSTSALRALTQLGGTGGVILVAVVVAALEWRRSRSWTPVLFLTVVMGGVSIVFNLTKWAVDRARPDFERLVGFSSSSFPSGHSATAAAMWAAFALLLSRRRSVTTRSVLAGVAAGVAVAVAASRVLLGVHWLTDVIAGLAIGWAWFAVSSIAFGGRILRFGAPVELGERLVDSVPAELGADDQRR